MVKSLKYLLLAIIISILYFIFFSGFLKLASAGLRPAGGGTGTVTSVTATSPLTSTGGATPDIALPVTAEPTFKGLTLTYGLAASTAAFTYDVSVGSITISGDTITDFTGTNLSVTGGVLNAASGAGDLLADGTIPLTANWDVGNFSITMRDLIAYFGVAGATAAFSGALTCATIDTGGGALEVLPVLKDLVTTTPLTGGTNDILPGTDADITVALNYATTNLLLDNAGKLAVGYDTTDFGVSGSSLTITDDGHAHTTTSISGLDVSADTNLAVTNPIKLTDDTLSLNYATTNLLLDGTGKLAVGYSSDFSVSGSSMSIVLNKDVVATAPVTVNGTTNVDNILPGADADLTIAIPAATDAVDGYLNTVAWAKFETKDINFTISSPSNTYIICGSSIPIINETPYAITISSISISADSDPTTEITGGLKWADSAIGWANATLINDIGTDAGIRKDASMTAGNVAANKVIYINFYAQPDSAMKFLSVTIHGKYQ